MQELKVKHSNEKPTLKEEIRFYSISILIAVGISIGYFTGMPSYYLGWIAFFISAFSVAGNDAIQTIGTFIESKRTTPLVLKALMICGLLFIVHIYAWRMDDREIHFHRLDSFKEVSDFNLLQLLAPVVLMIVTRLKAPISTTFLILSLFGGQNIDKMLTKSFLGYGIAFLSAMIVWGILCYVDRQEYVDSNEEDDPASEKLWGKLQWLSTACLWIAWLLQDTANIAVFLPRKLSVTEFVFGIGAISVALIIILYTNGGSIQEIVSEKSDISSAKAGTIVDLVYAGILLLFQLGSKMPMSTTWVFLGLLAGREIILHILTHKDKPYLETFRQVGKDVILASLGITVSILFYGLSIMVYPPKDTSNLSPTLKKLSDSFQQYIAEPKKSSVTHY
ncbi:MAG: hypothetical protein SFU98_04385 [Leptospiraceae bacterium]|nr:hypothetical protein [Leptospiraceae bacterium]